MQYFFLRWFATYTQRKRFNWNPTMFYIPPMHYVIHIENEIKAMHGFERKRERRKEEGKYL